MSESDKELSVRELFLKDIFFRYSFGISIIFFLGSSIFLGISWNKLPQQIPLLYSLPWGEQQLVSPIILIVVQSAIFIITLINMIIAYLTLKLSNFFSHTLLIGASFTSILGAIALIQIIRLVT